MELLTKFLSNQITLPEFLEKSEGKVYRSSKEGIELITTGLEKAIEVFNDSNIDYIRIERENHDSVIGYTIAYYKIKQVKETYTTKEDTIETIPFTSYFAFKIQTPKEQIVNNNNTYNYIGSNHEGIKYYLKEIYYDDTMSDEEFVEKYHSRLNANTIRPLDSIYLYIPKTDEFIFKSSYEALNYNISYDSPFGTEESCELNEILTSYPIIAQSITISTNGTINNRTSLDYLKNEPAANALIKTIRKIHKNLNDIFKK